MNSAITSLHAAGAGPTMVLGPAGVATRFVVAGKDLERNVRQTAVKVAGELVARTRSHSEK